MCGIAEEDEDEEVAAYGIDSVLGARGGVERVLGSRDHHSGRLPSVRDHQLHDALQYTLRDSLTASLPRPTGSTFTPASLFLLAQIYSSPTSYLNINLID